MPRFHAALLVCLLLLASEGVLGSRSPLRAPQRALRQQEEPAPNVTTEQQLACYVKELPAVQDFACKILYSTLRRAVDLMNNGTMTEDITLEHLREEHADKYNQSTYVTKPGYDEDTAAEVLDAARAAAEEGASPLDPPASFCELTRAAGFHHTMGAFYPFTIDTDFIEGSIRASPELEEKVFDHISEAFTISRANMSWDQVEDLIDASNGQYLLLDALNYLSDVPKSLYRHNVLNLPYIRNKLPSNVVPDDQWKLADPATVATCHADLLLNATDRVVMGDTWYDVDDKAFFAELLTSYNRSHLAGPSGSSVLLHTLFFDLLGHPETRREQALMLSAIAGDYIPFFHSLTEVLMSFSFELGEPYTLDMDPVEYVKRVASPYWQ